MSALVSVVRLVVACLATAFLCISTLASAENLSVDLVLDPGELERTTVPSFSSYVTTEGSGGTQDLGVLGERGSGLSLTPSLTPSLDRSYTLSGALVALVETTPKIVLETVAKTAKPTSSPQATAVAVVVGGAALIARSGEDTPQLDPGTTEKRAARREVEAWVFEHSRQQEDLTTSQYGGDPLSPRKQTILTPEPQPGTEAWWQWDLTRRLLGLGEPEDPFAPAPCESVLCDVRASVEPNEPIASTATLASESSERIPYEEIWGDITDEYRGEFVLVHPADLVAASSDPDVERPWTDGPRFAHGAFHGAEEPLEAWLAARGRSSLAPRLTDDPEAYVDIHARANLRPFDRRLTACPEDLASCLFWLSEYNALDGKVRSASADTESSNSFDVQIRQLRLELAPAIVALGDPARSDNEVAAVLRASRDRLVAAYAPDSGFSIWVNEEPYAALLALFASRDGNELAQSRLTNQIVFGVLASRNPMSDQLLIPIRRRYIDDYRRRGGQVPIAWIPITDAP